MNSYFDTDDNEEFIFRYSNIVTLLFSCVFLEEKAVCVCWNIVRNHYHECVISFANGEEGRISFSAFGGSVEEYVDEIIQRYKYMFSVIEKEYPVGHPFKNPGFCFDGIAFSLAYCLYIVPKYFHNDERYG